jgi:ketosteroid isomerase-like protein
MAQSIQEAHEQFYRALNKTLNGDPSSMDDIWEHSAQASTTHPMGHWAVGWDEVKATWQVISEVASEGNIQLKDLQIFEVGELAYTIGIEVGPCKLMGRLIQFEMQTTNIYRRTGTTWKMIHHHPDKVPEAANV